MNVVVFEAEEWEQQACRRLETAHVLACTSLALDGDTAGKYEKAEVVSTFVNSKLNAQTLASLPLLKLIATRSTGVDHIDLDICARRGITVVNVPDYGDATVAEHTFALLLATVRHVVDAAEHTRRGNFSQAGLRGMELFGKTLGVIGTGRIGRHVIRIAKGFGMKVLAFDAVPNPTAAKDLEFSYAQLDELLDKAEIVTLHIPATAESADLISDREFGLMKPGSFLINTARGSIVNMDALVRALTSGKLRGVGLDVLPFEPLLRDEAELFRTSSPRGDDFRALVANHVVMQFPNVLVTPHSAYNTDEAVRRIIATTVENIEAFAHGKTRNVVAGIR